MAIGNEYLRQGCALAQRAQHRTAEVEHRLTYLPFLSCSWPMPACAPRQTLRGKVSWQTLQLGGCSSSARLAAVTEALDWPTS